MPFCTSLRISANIRNLERYFSFCVLFSFPFCCYCNTTQKFCRKYPVFNFHCVNWGGRFHVARTFFGFMSFFFSVCFNFIFIPLTPQHEAVAGTLPEVRLLFSIACKLLIKNKRKKKNIHFLFLFSVLYVFFCDCFMFNIDIQKSSLFLMN